MNADQASRNNLRPRFLSGLSRGGRKQYPDEEEWCTVRLRKLLDAHYACSRPARSVVLGDVETMLAEKYAQITVDRKRSQKTLTPRKLLPEEISTIQEWYDNKMEVLKGAMGAEQFERERAHRAAQREQAYKAKMSKRGLDSRKYIRQRLFSGKATKANSQGHFIDLDEKQWLVPKWAEYMKLHFELRAPGPPKVVEELRKMVDSHKTFQWNGRVNGRVNYKCIQSRCLGDFEIAKLEELLPIYEEKLRIWWEAKSQNAAAKAASDVEGTPPAKKLCRRSCAVGR